MTDTQTQPRIIARLFYDHGETQRAFSDTFMDAAGFAMKRAVIAEFRPRGWQPPSGGPGSGKGSPRFFDHDQVIALGRQGLTTSQIVARVGASDVTVRKVLKDAGIVAPLPPTTGPNLTPETIQILKAKRRMGLSYRACSKAAKISHEGARRALQKMGL